MTSLGLEIVFEPSLRITGTFPEEKLGVERMLAFLREKIHMQRF